MKLRLNANAIVLNDQGKVLFIRLKGGPFKGGLSIPGGGINPGELSHQTIKREVKEETGIDVEDLNPFGFCELVNNPIEQHRVVLLLYGKGSGEPIETEEGISEWLNPNEVLDQLIPFAKESIKIFQNKGLHFFRVD